MRGDDMSSTGSAQMEGEATRDEPTLEDLDASTGVYESVPDDAVVVRYYSDEVLLASMRCRCPAPSDNSMPRANAAQRKGPRAGRGPDAWGTRLHSAGAY